MLAIVVVSYNTRALLLECVASVHASLDRSGLQGEVWVVDNASSDDSVTEVKCRFPATHLIANSDNRGFAAANNQALRAMGFGEQTVGSLPGAVLLLNPDTVVHGDALRLMYRVLTEQPNTGAVGAALVYEDGRFQHSAFRFPTLFQVLLDFFPINHRLADSRLNGRYPRARYDAGRPFPIDHPLGAALMVRGETIEQVGLFDEAYFMYCEEIDWCIRIRRAGLEIRCVPKARITHYAGQSTRQSRGTMLVALWRSRFHLFEKHYSPIFRRLARWLVALGVARQVHNAKRAGAKGEMDRNELDDYISAHRSILEL